MKVRATCVKRTNQTLQQTDAADRSPNHVIYDATKCPQQHLQRERCLRSLQLLADKIALRTAAAYFVHNENKRKQHLGLGHVEIHA